MEHSEAKAAELLAVALKESASVNHLKLKFRRYYLATQKIREQFTRYMQRFRDMERFLEASWDLQV